MNDEASNKTDDAYRHTITRTERAQAALSDTVYQLASEIGVVPTYLALIRTAACVCVSGGGTRKIWDACCDGAWRYGEAADKAADEKK